MRANKSVSALETRFRRALWRQGARGFRRGVSLPGRPDIVFSRVRLAIFVHGCYWHRCPVCNLPSPKANAEFWAEKFESNLRRDLLVSVQLGVSGWDVETVWEHDLREDIEHVATKLASRVEQLRQA